MKRKYIFITSIVAVMIGIFIITPAFGLQTQVDGADDVRGLKYTSDYELLVIDDTFGFMDVVDITWVNDSSNYNVSIQFAEDVDVTKIYAKQLVGWVSFYNGSDPDNEDIGTPFKVSFTGTDAGDSLNGTAFIKDGDDYDNEYSDCAVVSGKYINWSVPTTLFENFTASYPAFETWNPFSFVVYTYQNDDTTYIYWDSVAQDSYWDEIWDQLSDITSYIPGYSTFITLAVAIVAVFVIARKTIRNNAKMI